MGPRSKFVGTNLDSFETNWTLELDLALDLSMRLGSSNHELSFWAPFFFWLFEPIDFPLKMVPCRFSLYLPLFGLGPSSKGQGSNLWLSLNRIAQFHWTPDLGSSSKVAFSEVCWNHEHITIAYWAVYEDTNWSWVHEKQPLQSASCMATIWNHVLLGILLRSQSSDHP
jgi:hypothetical protein